MRAKHIRFVDPAALFGDNPGKLFTNTDHLQYDGNLLMADIIAKEHPWTRRQ